MSVVPAAPGLPFRLLVVSRPPRKALHLSRKNPKVLANVRVVSKWPAAAWDRSEIISTNSRLYVQLVLSSRVRRSNLNLGNDVHTAPTGRLRYWRIGPHRWYSRSLGVPCFHHAPLCRHWREKLWVSRRTVLARASIAYRSHFR